MTDHRPPPRGDLASRDAAAPDDSLGVVVVDHGSRRAESNEMLEDFVDRFARAQAGTLVEPAHMELAEPSIATAFARCVARGATTVVVAPLFFWPGNHWTRDIPALTAEAAADHPGVRYLVAGPIGSHPMLGDLVRARVAQCLAHAGGDGDACELCAGTDRCRFVDPPR